jgi:hypothetical protein
LVGETFMRAPNPGEALNALFKCKDWNAFALNLAYN